MNRSNIRSNVFIASTILLTLALVASLWRNASAKQVETDSNAVSRLTKLSEGVAKIDSSTVEQILKLSAALDGTDCNHQAWLASNNVAQLARNLECLRNELARISDEEIARKTAAMPALTEACLAAVTSANQAATALDAPIRDLRRDLATMKEDLDGVSGQMAAYRRELIAASRTPHESAINDLPMQEMFGCNIAAIGTSSEVLDQSERNDFYRRVLTETPNFEWMKIEGNTLVSSPDLLGMDIVVRTFREGEDLCQTKLVRFSHGENIRLDDGAQRVIILFCKPERMTKAGQYEREQNGVRICGKQMIALNTAR